jgi:hypothetical protein
MAFVTSAGLGSVGRSPATEHPATVEHVHEGSPGSREPGATLVSKFGSDAPDEMLKIVAV